MLKLLKRSLIFTFIFMLFFSMKVFITDSAYYTDTQKQLIRDTNRLNDLTKLKEAIEKYRTRNGEYPKLNTGTYIKGEVFSVWNPAWSNFCTLIGLSPCPVDPINEIVNCNCNIFGSTCDPLDLNTTTCYTPKLGKFACTKDSHIYEYQALNNGRNYALRMNFEYAGNVDWKVESNVPDNIISVTGNCNVNNGSTIVSSGTAKCGNKVIEYGEACDGNSRIDFCTLPTGDIGRKVVNCSATCKFNDPGLSTCQSQGFCGDSITECKNSSGTIFYGDDCLDTTTQKLKTGYTGEECDGGSQAMCFSYSDMKGDTGDPYTINSKYNWYTEQYRYCKLNCTYDQNYIDGIAYCGGYCGDGIIQNDKNEECDLGANFASKWSNEKRKFLFCSDRTVSSTNTEDDSECIDDSNCSVNTATNTCYNKNLKDTDEKRHCDMKTCRFTNNKPAINFDFFTDNLSSNSYIKSSVWSGNNYQYRNDYFNTGNTDLIIADKQGSDYVAVYHSDFIEIKFNASDADNDYLTYKYSINQAYNSGLKIQYKNGNSFINYTSGTFVPSNIIRLLPTDNNIHNTNGSYLFDNSYSGFYKLGLTVNDNHTLGADTYLNPHNSEISSEISFKIGPGCGDRILDTNLGEVCEFMPSKYVSNIYMNWGTYVDPSTNLKYAQPDGTTANCVMLKFNVASDSYNWGGTFDNVPCSDNGYFMCEKSVSQDCTGYILGENDNCYKLFNISKTFDDARSYCWGQGGDLVAFDDEKELRFVKNNSNFNGDKYYWIGYKRQNSSNPFQSVMGGAYNENSKSYGLFENYLYNGGAGKSVSNNYSCSLPWENNSCSVRAGYCGDGLYNNEFEECDKTDKTSFGQGTSISQQYECGVGDGVNDNNPNDLLCRDQYGYCGDNEKQINYEHCDPTHRTTAPNSASISYGLNVKTQYLCNKLEAGYAGVVYNDYNDYEANKNKDSTNACRKSFGGYCGDSKIQLFYEKMRAVILFQRKNILKLKMIGSN